jgi:hypothetical protein
MWALLTTSLCLSAPFQALAAPANSWERDITVNNVSCTYSTDAEIGYKLLLEVASNPAMVPTVQAELCTNFPMQAVSGQNFDICGPVKASVTHDQAWEAVQYLTFYCSQPQTGKVGGRVNITRDISIQL